LFDAPELSIDAEKYDGASLIVDVDGFEGPLHLLLELARSQKVDLARISILKLVDQYLEFVTRAKKERIEIAADYLVMAAWLAYLKSRLLLPKKRDDDNETAPELLSSHLSWRLKRLETMRNTGAKIMAMPQTGSDVFVRGAAELGVSVTKLIEDADLFDLLKAYCRQRNKQKSRVHKVRNWPVYGLEEARKNLKDKLPHDEEWHRLGKFAPNDIKKSPDAPPLSSYYASLFSAGLEMVKSGDINIRQLANFEEVYIQNKRQKRHE
jgi:segregation and condensation protein A